METVKVVCGQQAQYFTFASPPNAPPVLSTTATAFSAPMPKDGIYATYQGTVTGTGAQSATIIVQATNDPYSAGQDDIVNRKWQNIQINTTNASTAVTSPDGSFRPDQTGNQVYATGVPNGTTFTYVSASSGTLSANATATQTRVAARFQANKWVTLATISLSGTAEASDGFATVSAWKWVRANVSAITGTNATVQVIQGN